MWKWFCIRGLKHLETCRLQLLLLWVVVRSKAHLLHLGIKHVRNMQSAKQSRAKGTKGIQKQCKLRKSNILCLAAVWAKSFLSSILAPTPPTSWDECGVSTSVQLMVRNAAAVLFFLWHWHYSELVRSKRQRTNKEEIKNKQRRNKEETNANSDFLKSLTNPISLWDMISISKFSLVPLASFLKMERHQTPPPHRASQWRDSSWPQWSERDSQSSNITIHYGPVCSETFWLFFDWLWSKVLLFRPPSICSEHCSSIAASFCGLLRRFEPLLWRKRSLYPSEPSLLQ